jgi:pyrroloquinoline-quinone synthase
MTRTFLRLEGSVLPVTAKNRQKGTSMDILARLDETRRATNVLEHPFYQRWSAGELGAEELGCYAAEYRHAVIALADASTLAAEQAAEEHAEGLRRHAAEETAHVALWEQFARASGARSGSEPMLAETAGCVESWTAGEDLLERLAVLYVLEAGQPEISRTKLDGLAAHYGYAEEGPATEYFSVHELRDVEHARQAGELILDLIGRSEDPEGHAERMVRRAEQALRGNWELLTGVEERARA